MKAIDLIGLLQNYPDDTEVLVATSGENANDPDTAVERITGAYERQYDKVIVLTLDGELREL